MLAEASDVPTSAHTAPSLHGHLCWRPWRFWKTQVIRCKFRMQFSVAGVHFTTTEWSTSPNEYYCRPSKACIPRSVTASLSSVSTRTASQCYAMSCRTCWTATRTPNRLTAKTFLLSEFLYKYAEGYTAPKLKRKALVRGHSYQTAILQFPQNVELLRNAGLDPDIPDSGCCGMAGSFGYEDEHCDRGKQCRGRVLLPAVRAAADDALIIRKALVAA